MQQMISTPWPQRPLLGVSQESLLCVDPSLGSGSSNNMKVLDVSPWTCLDPDRGSHIPIPHRPWAVSVSLSHACSLQPVENCHQQLPSCLMLMQSARNLYTWRQFRLWGEWLKFKRSHAIVILKRNLMIHHFWCSLICLIKLYFTHRSFLMGQFK